MLRYTFRHVMVTVSSRIKLVAGTDETRWPLAVLGGGLLLVTRSLSVFSKVIRPPTSGRIGDMMWISFSITSRWVAPTHARIFADKFNPRFSRTRTVVCTYRGTVVVNAFAINNEVSLLKRWPPDECFILILLSVYKIYKIIIENLLICPFVR